MAGKLIKDRMYKNTLARSIDHPSHQTHSLTLVPYPTYPGGEFSCNACGEDGKTSVCNCNICEFDLHRKCAALPETMKRKDHEHNITLMYSVDQALSTGTEFKCDVCFRDIRGGL
ncbi:hypothetical protein POM88_030002 [Heracleum sosnowskyi]|uniref:DC1 domain-containing protein n=1 Tax=Heracleum sosnowskyi TaxID=360622 RepID=A0AAD8HUS0_9APIA|nr:hypothetical protein POM88_030002 [Heracleum sosnowskyi]